MPRPSLAQVAAHGLGGGTHRGHGLAQLLLAHAEGTGPVTDLVVLGEVDAVAVGRADLLGVVGHGGGFPGFGAPTLRLLPWRPRESGARRPGPVSAGPAPAFAAVATQAPARARQALGAPAAADEDVAHPHRGGGLHRGAATSRGDIDGVDVHFHVEFQQPAAARVEDAHAVDHLAGHGTGLVAIVDVVVHQLAVRIDGGVHAEVIGHELAQRLVVEGAEQLRVPVVVLVDVFLLDPPSP